MQLKQELSKTKEILKKCFSEEQIKALQSNIKIKWSNEAISQALRMRFALGFHGYNYLRLHCKYPIPHYSTVTRRIRNIKIDFGIFNDLLDPLKCKISGLHSSAKDCIISVDELKISGKLNYDKCEKKMYGKITLPSTASGEGNHVTVVLARGLSATWKQAVAAEVTGSRTEGSDMRAFVLNVIESLSNAGLNVKGIVSDMGSNNRGMWTCLGIDVSRNNRVTSFSFNGQIIHVLADACHLAKNLKQATQTHCISLSENVQKSQRLPTNVIDGNYITLLWKREVESAAGLRLLQHLNYIDIFPNNFSKMNVGSAIRYFDVRTAASLETAVRLKYLPSEALTTAWFVRLIYEWIKMCTSRVRKTSITKRNKIKKVKFLNDFIDIVQNMQIGRGGWKPLNTGLILTSISIINLTEYVFQQKYDFFLTSRVTQDALENLFSQIRRRAGAMPNALEVRKALKNIVVSQYIGNVDNSSYTNDSDYILLDNLINSYTGSIENASQISNTSAESVNLLNFNQYTNLDAAVLYYVAGSTVNAILKLKLCNICKQFLTCQDTTGIPDELRCFSDYSNMGGLKFVGITLYNFIIHCEKMFMAQKKSILESNKIDLDVVLESLKTSGLLEAFPTCCNIIDKLMHHFFNVRCYSIVTNEKTKATQKVYGSASAKII